jgi:demethoxyubiquinone hydroxylase (CLK1/Coq7/Cat5 family)
MDDSNYHRKQLIHTLYSAYSGELAAGLAYNGHWRCLKDQEQIDQVRKIEDEEWKHRAIVGEMLKNLGAHPQRPREIMMFCIGKTVSCACFIIGWFMPMYFAGRLETANVKEYETAAEHARALGMLEVAEKLMELSDTEYEHERFFWEAVTGHPFLPIFRTVFPWTPVKDRSKEIKGDTNQASIKGID